VRFVLKHERDGRIHFASLASALGSAALATHGLEPEHCKSVVFIESERVALRSTAALRIASYLAAPWSWARFAIVIPTPLRDLAYRAIARCRYAIFGRREACVVPGPDDAHRFHDDVVETRVSADSSS